MLRPNRKDTRATKAESTLRAPNVPQEVAIMEKVITDRTWAILLRFQQEFRGNTYFEIQIDKLMQSTNRRVAYDTAGVQLMAFPAYRVGHYPLSSNRHVVLLAFLVEIVTKYHWAVKDHILGPLNEVSDRAEYMLKRGLDSTSTHLVDGYPGYYLLFDDEWADELARREDKKIQAQKRKGNYGTARFEPPESESE